ncbi:hypothetical protein LWI28_016994 [Acer negundo]|uniref:Uncharacterized protein n=1 Tax=Acer negundo TaxID=4023 RepID=A0AAD5J132_ACENE|nr:hypothetical protein LWI28_016994 [Acer negundo]KAK4848759.1 hypothetical protein QYF36_017013 [Acer negundo]
MGFLLNFIEHEWQKEALMGSVKQSGDNIVSVIFIFSLLLCSSMAKSQNSSNTYDPELLQALFRSYANETLSRHHTGNLYNISLPANFTTVQVSVVRLRSGRFWSVGANFSYFQIPKGVIPMPYAKRIAIVFDNLGNLSSYYYKVPNHSLVAPVVGFNGYDASNLSALNNEKLIFNVTGNPILISFPQISLEDHKNMTPICVKFGDGGSVEFSNMTQPNVCVTQGAGHFSVVVPSPPPPPKKEEKQNWKRWVVGFVGSFLGLILLIVVGVIVFMVLRRKKIKEMESESEKGVAFDTFWIGRSRMPSATMIRTQPALEDDYVA